LKLYTNPASPFARKARVIAHELGLKLEELNTNPWDNAEFRRINPLGTIPALVLDDGSVLIDSPVICEYLNNIGGGKFFPGMSIFRQNSGRWKALGLQALADGIGDAGVALVVDRKLPPEKQNETAQARHSASIAAGLDALERTKFSDPPTIGEIATGCTLGYLDFRLKTVLDWRATRPKLAEWYAKFSQFQSMLATAPPAS
jgi:glutathione S-transferase